MDDMPTEAPGLCTRCKSRPRASTEGTNMWCRECNTAYMKEYQAMKIERSERGGYVKGIKAMRELVVQEFDRLGASTFSGDEIAKLVHQMPGPQLEQDEAKAS